MTTVNAFLTIPKNAEVALFSNTIVVSYQKKVQISSKLVVLSANLLNDSKF